MPVIELEPLTSIVDEALHDLSVRRCLPAVLLDPVATEPRWALVVLLLRYALTFVADEEVRPLQLTAHLKKSLVELKNEVLFIQIGEIFIE